MPLRSCENLYPGVNPHLNSFLQAEQGEWESFHSLHITYLYEILTETLPPGYRARPEKSLQISEINPPDTPVKRHPTRADVPVYHDAAALQPSTQNSQTATLPAYHLQIRDTFPEEDYLNAVTIYQVEPGDSPFGRPVTRLEILSPANKPGGTHHAKYIQKRWQTLQAGLRLVELDYLHTTRPLLKGIASYRNREADAFPNHIFVTDPRPTLEKGDTLVYGVRVMEALPVIRIPLAGADTLLLECGAVYARTYSRLFPVVEVAVDYEQLPVKFDSYTGHDKYLIEQHMQQLQQRHAPQ